MRSDLSETFADVLNALTEAVRGIGKSMAEERVESIFAEQMSGFSSSGGAGVGRILPSETSTLN